MGGNNSTRRIAVCGVFAALSVAFMLMGSVMPFFTYLAPAVSGILILPVAIEYKFSSAIVLFSAVSFLCFILVPNKESFLGWYPCVRLKLEKISNKILLLIIKFTIFNASIAAACALVFFVISIDQLITEFESAGTLFLIVFFLACNATFYIYDKAQTRLVSFYMYFLRGKLMRR